MAGSRPKIGVIEAGAPPPELIGQFGPYGPMFRALLGEDFDWAYHDIRAGSWPAAPTEADAWIISGSAAGVYEDHDWIAPLEAFIRRAYGQVGLVGICFGHQIMAQALGGQVTRSDRGWAIGVQTYHPVDGAATLGPVSVAASHRDQVMKVPAGAQVILANDHCPVAGLDYRGNKAMSLQFHPEFGHDYAAALIHARRGTIYDPEFADAAIASLAGPTDRAAVAESLKDFIQQV